MTAFRTVRCSVIQGLRGATVLVALALITVSAARAATERPEGPPPWRVGGRVGFTVDVMAAPESSGYVVEVFLRIPPATIGQLSRDASGDAQLHSSIRVKSRVGGRGVASESDITLTAADSVSGQGKVLLARFPAAPGPCQIEVKLDDLLSRRKGLVLSNKNRNESTGLVGQVDLPRAQAGRDLSNIEFVWPLQDASAGLAFVRGGRTRVPNPERLYGLYAGTVEAAFTARSKVGDERPWKYVARVFDSAGQPIAQVESTAVGGRFLEGGAKFDLSDVPAGGYDYHTTRVSYTLGQQRKLSGTIAASSGTLYNGTKSEATFSGRWGVVPRFSMEPAVTLDRVSLPYGDFTAELLNSRFTLTPSARMLISSLIQYNAAANSLSSSVRLRWEYTGGSELFVVYSDGRNTLTPGYPDLLNRTFAVKATRLLRF